MDESSGRHPLAFLLAGSLLWCIGCDRNAAAPPPGATPPIAAASVPTIVVDSVHQLREHGAAGQPYLMAATPGLVIDGSRFPLHDPHRRARLPNVIQIIYDHSLFTAHWPLTGRQVSTLDRSTLKLVRGDEFGGFKPGTQAYIAIGHASEDPATRQQQFTPFWMTSIVFH